MARISLSASLAVLLSSAALCQKPEFDIADVHVSQRSDWVKKPANSLQGGFLNGSRYELRRATMLDMIKTAYAVDADKVYGGPSWLDYDRFEVIAKAPPATRPEALRLMLQSLLVDRFKLVANMDSRPIPGYAISVGKGKPKLKPAEGTGLSGCQSQLTVKDIPFGNIQCRNVTMDAFASALRRFASPYFENRPVVDASGLEGSWDIDLQYPLRGMSLNAGVATPTDTGGGITEALDKQLGLTVVRQNVPQPVLVVESVNAQPSANPPGVATSLPPLPSPEFEVASIRPCEGGNISLAPRFQAGGRVTATCEGLMTMISQAWNLAPFEPLIGAPKWLSDGSSPNLSIVAKAPAGTFMDAQGVQDRDALNAMMRALLVDRFKMAIHYEERPMDAHTLVAVKPKLTKADPSNRTGCTRQIGDALAIRLLCQNISMAQFAEQIQGYDSNIFYSVLDSTGLEGAWDFTLNYNVLLNAPGAPAPRLLGAAPVDPTEPTGGISFVDAIEKQLGLRLEIHKRPERVLVVDHIEEKPTEN